MLTLDISMTPSGNVLAGEFMLLGDALGDQKKLIRDLVDQVVRPAFRKNFATEGTHSGNRWAPLEEFTIMDRGSSNPILDRGRGAIGLKYVAQQKNLWTFQSTFDQDEAFISIEDAWARIPYGVAHQFGYYNALVGREVVARPFWRLSPEDVEKIEQATADWVDRNIRSSIGA